MAEDDEALEPLKIVPPDSVDDDEEDYIEQPLEIVPPKPDEHAKMSTRAKLSRVKNNNKIKQKDNHMKTDHSKLKYEMKTKDVFHQDHNDTLARQLKDQLEKRTIVLYGIGAVKSQEMTSSKRPNNSDVDWLFILIHMCSICTIFVVIFIVISPFVSRKSSLYGPAAVSNIHPSVSLSISPSD